ncbi:MerR family transcriptional regulator [Culicoidibacter larvae]|uniref:MerR family transcriptional regulator n=1 Tax=Culicoidibacter larvae TaxID=2579976 RepID=A0A5R8QF13_9FIRM|nr:MerR family transcriptional regulator [Culicoidibacter larvae]TLG76562.1 MerR family transcriptional regulator [Culicoidibacter larvae]
MYQIGEFSKITRLTIQTLRYYDNEGILTPSYRDQQSGYRFYNDEDFARAEMIIRLKQFDFSIAELKEVLVAIDSGEELQYFLDEKREQLNFEVERKQQLIREIEAQLGDKQDERRQTSYQINELDIPAMLIASVSYQGRYDEVGKHIGQLFKAVKGKAAGPVFICLHDDSYQEAANIEICAPISRELNDSKVTTRVLAGGSAISTMHYGGYDLLQFAYKALFTYIFEHNLIAQIPSREVYHRGPGMFFKGNPNNYQTEVIILVEREGANNNE